MVFANPRELFHPKGARAVLLNSRARTINGFEVHKCRPCRISHEATAMLSIFPKAFFFVKNNIFNLLTLTTLYLLH